MVFATVIRSLPKHPPRSLGERFPRAPEAAIELLVEMLRFSPGRRITAAQALAHPYLAELHDEDAEPLHDEPFEAHDIEQRSLDWPTLHQLVESEVGLYRRRAAATDGARRAAQKKEVVVLRGALGISRRRLWRGGWSAAPRLPARHPSELCAARGLFV